MASKIGLSYRREAALGRLQAAAAALGERGIDAGVFPTEGRDRDVLAVEQIEYVADLLERIAAAWPDAGSKKAAKAR